MKEIEELEAALDAKVEEWNAQLMQKLSLEENVKLIQYFKNPEVLNECLQRAKNNKEVVDILYPLSLKLLIDFAETECNDLLEKFTNKKITLEEFITKSEEIYKNEKSTVYERLASMLMIIAYDENYDVAKYEADLKRDILELSLISNNLAHVDTISLYGLINDILELVFPFRTRYYEKYKIDLIEGCKESFEETLDLLQEVTNQILADWKKYEETHAGENEAAVDLPEGGSKNE